MSDTTPTPEACRGCVANGWQDDCYHSLAYWPVAAAIAEAIHGEAADDQKAGWFTDDAEQVAGDIVRLLPRQALHCRHLGSLALNPDRTALLFNERLVVTILGTNDGSGETITELVADLGRDPMSAPTPETTDVEALLAAHYATGVDMGTPRQYTQRGGWNIECTCGEVVGESGDDDIEARHCAHVAAALAPWVAQLRADALREAATALPAETEGSEREGTARWPESLQDTYSLAIEEAQDALRARADRVAPITEAGQ